MSQHMSVEFKQIVLRVKKYFEDERVNGLAEIELNQVTKRTAKALDISESSVKRVTSEERKTGTVSEPKSRSGRRKIEIDDFMKGVIRRQILLFYTEKKFPTIAELHQRLKDDLPDWPQVCNSTLKRWVKEMNFSFRKLVSKPILMEQYNIAAARSQYLYSVKRYREEGWKIFYTDETWCGANHSKKFGWVEMITPEAQANFDRYRGTIQTVNGFRGGIQRPSGAGQRVIILHIGNESGFLDGCMKCFIGKKGSADYHDEMNKQHFEEWFRFVLALIPDKSVIVLDQATYHTMLDPQFRNPTTSWRKNEIVEWLKNRNVPLPEGAADFNSFTRPVLLQLAQQHRFEKKFLLEKIAKDVREDMVKVLWLPVAHCEFNPIELVWAYVKNYVAKHNSTFKIKDVLNLCKTAMENIPNSVWPNCLEHAKKVEQSYREKEHLVDVAVEPLVINLNEEDDEENTDDAEEISDDADDSDGCL